LSDIKLNDIVDARGQTYGDPRVNHARTANLWNAYIENILLTRPADTRLTATDVCFLNILQKVARLQHGAKHVDSVVDVKGYSDNVLSIWGKSDDEFEVGCTWSSTSSNEGDSDV
tara:strand:- start:5863 stop:6207 length:345 start_codon:yes stop_codon:yes gene_type:complete